MIEPVRPSKPATPSASSPPSDPGWLANQHTARGVELAGRHLFREAIEEFRQAVTLIPDNAIARNNLGMTLGRAGALAGDEAQLAEAVEQHRLAIRLQPGTVGLYHSLAAVLAIADRISEALTVLDEALSLDPRNAKTRALRSVALLTLGDYEKGWEGFDSRLDDPANRAREIPGVRRWRGENLSGALLINGMAEGQGDCIQGIRFAAEVRRRVASTVLLCLPSMARLMGQCEGIDRVVTSWEALPAVEAQIAPMYCAEILRPTPETLKGNAYLSADPATVEQWRPAVEAIPGLRVGIVWQGNSEYRLDARRSYRLDQTEPLARVGGVTLVSLQKEQGAEQLAELGGRFPLVNLGADYARGDWMDTAAVVSGLDVIIAPDTAVAHLAGALGKPVWIGLPRPAEWRWGVRGDTSPWYSTARLFRQDRPGDWAGVFRRMAAELAERCLRGRPSGGVT